jgi:hypothetical protein
VIAVRALSVRTSAGIPFTIVHLAAGEIGYFPAARNDKHAMVEFYDARHPGTPAGRFVVRYRASTLLENPDDARGLALSLHEQDWRIDAQTMTVVRAWITEAAPVRDQEPLISEQGCWAGQYTGRDRRRRSGPSHHRS